MTSKATCPVCGAPNMEWKKEGTVGACEVYSLTKHGCTPPALTREEQAKADAIKNWQPR